MKTLILNNHVPNLPDILKFHVSFGAEQIFTITKDGHVMIYTNKKDKNALVDKNYKLVGTLCVPGVNDMFSFKNQTLFTCETGLFSLTNKFERILPGNFIKFYFFKKQIYVVEKSDEEFILQKLIIREEKEEQTILNCLLTDLNVESVELHRSRKMIFLQYVQDELVILSDHLYFGNVKWEWEEEQAIAFLVHPRQADVEENSQIYGSVITEKTYILFNIVTGTIIKKLKLTGPPEEFLVSMVFQSDRRQSGKKEAKDQEKSVENSQEKDEEISREKKKNCDRIFVSDSVGRIHCIDMNDLDPVLNQKLHIHSKETVLQSLGRDRFISGSDRIYFLNIRTVKHEDVVEEDSKFEEIFSGTSGQPSEVASPSTNLTDEKTSEGVSTLSENANTNFPSPVLPQKQLYFTYFSDCKMIYKNSNLLIIKTERDLNFYTIRRSDSLGQSEEQNLDALEKKDIEYLYKYRFTATILDFYTFGTLFSLQIGHKIKIFAFHLSSKLQIDKIREFDGIAHVFRENERKSELIYLAMDGNVRKFTIETGTDEIIETEIGFSQFFSKFRPVETNQNNLKIENKKYSTHIYHTDKDQSVHKIKELHNRQILRAVEVAKEDFECEMNDRGQKSLVLMAKDQLFKVKQGISLQEETEFPTFKCSEVKIGEFLYDIEAFDEYIVVVKWDKDEITGKWGKK